MCARCSVLQSEAGRCSVLQHVLQCVAERCSVLQRVLQCVLVVKSLLPEWAQVCVM